MAKKITYNIVKTDYPLKIDASRLNNFIKCPREYFYVYHTDLPDKRTIWPGTVFGKAIHQVVETMLLDANNKTLKPNYKGLFANIYFAMIADAKEKKLWKENRFYDEEEMIKLGDKYANLICQFILNYLITDKTINILAEQRFEVPWEFDERFFAVGLADIILFYENAKANIYDVKTTSFNETYYCMDWDRNIQSKMYEYFLYKTHNIIPDAFGFLVVNKNEKTLFLKNKIIDKEEFLQIEKYFSYITETARNLDTFIHNREKFKMTDFYEYNKCKWCGYKKICEVE